MSGTDVTQMYQTAVRRLEKAVNQEDTTSKAVFITDYDRQASSVPHTIGNVWRAVAKDASPSVSAFEASSSDRVAIKDGKMVCRDVVSGSCVQSCRSFALSIGSPAFSIESAGNDMFTCEPHSSINAAKSIIPPSVQLPGGTWRETAWSSSQPTGGQVGLYDPRMELDNTVLAAWLRGEGGKWVESRTYVRNGATYNNIDGVLTESLNGTQGMAMLTFVGGPWADVSLLNNVLTVGKAKPVSVQAGDVLYLRGQAGTPVPCNCTPCGEKKGQETIKYASGVCSPETSICGASIQGPGCYTDTSDECDCATGRTVPKVGQQVIVKRAAKKAPPKAVEIRVLETMPEGPKSAEFLAGAKDKDIVIPGGTYLIEKGKAMSQSVRDSKSFKEIRNLLFVSGTRDSSVSDCRRRCADNKDCLGYSLNDASCALNIGSGGHIVTSKGDGYFAKTPHGKVCGFGVDESDAYSLGKINIEEGGCGNMESIPLASEALARASSSLGQKAWNLGEKALSTERRLSREREVQDGLQRDIYLGMGAAGMAEIGGALADEQVQRYDAMRRDAGLLETSNQMKLGGWLIGLTAAAALLGIFVARRGSD